MTKQIAIIDPFIKSPAVNCFNGLVDLLQTRASYHMPSLMGLQSLEKERTKAHAYIVLGSASHVHENLPWQSPLAQILVDELKKGKPILGCCFGHQLICHALGSTVNFYHPSEEKLAGVREITITQNFWNYKQGEKFVLPVTHRQIVENLGPDLIGVGTGIPHDIVIHKSLPFLGTQAHPEASDHFCVEDIKTLSPKEKMLGQSSGKLFIQRFFKYFQLI